MTAATQAASAESAQAVNIATRVIACAQRLPDKPAVISCTGLDNQGRTRFQCVTFRELADDIDAYARGLHRVGVTRGMRTILMVKPGRAFFALTFALLRIGAVPVLIDPGMGRRKLIDCLADVEAEAFIGIPLAHVARKLFPRAFRSVRICVTVGRRWAWGGLSSKDIRDASSTPLPPTDLREADIAAILFTSGSTGPAKGVVYTHGIFDAQVACLNSQYGYSEDEVDLATFPLFALFDAALGMTAVIPEMNPSQPAKIDPPRIIAAIRDHNVSHMFGSPALLNRLSRHLVEHRLKLPKIKRVMTAGAPVPTAVLERMRSVLPESAELFTPYGATESLPIASIESRTILAETAEQTARGRGICIGQPLPGIDARIIAIDDDAIADWSQASELSAGEIGEICVRGPVVTREYFRKPDATARAKIQDGDTFWHRMGDVGYLDDAGRLWFCGRKTHRVQTASGTIFTIPCEAIFNQHKDVYRTALVGIGQPGQQEPILCVELEPGVSASQQDRIKHELEKIAEENTATQNIHKFLIHPSFPVDVRHNAKIFREELTVWAKQRMKNNR